MFCFTALMHGPMLPVASSRKTMSATPLTFGSWLTGVPRCGGRVPVALFQIVSEEARNAERPNRGGSAPVVAIQPRGRTGERTHMRTLASIQTVNAAEPIPNAD